MKARSRTVVDRDLEWEKAWKAHPSNPWFRYQADAYAAWIRRRLPPRDDGGRLLKTNAFDEACGFPDLMRVFDGTRTVLMDVSPLTLTQALRELLRWGRAPVGCVTDVRSLAFRPDSFDVVLSASTLDHFADERNISVALGELCRVLRSGGHLLLALDNPSNPILRARRLVHWVTGPLGGLIPFAMGRTLSQRRLVATLRREGFEVLHADFLLHTPRIAALWLGEWAARGRRDCLAGWLVSLFGRLERALAPLPTRRWTGHFVIVDCRRSPTIGAAEARAGPAASPEPSRIAKVIGAGRVLEHRVRCGYLRRVPAPILVLVDPAVRVMAGMARRGLAVPLYLRQPVGLWSGPCAGQTVTVATWGRPRDARPLLDLLFDGEPTVRWLECRTYREVLGSWSELDLGAELFIAATTPALSAAFRRRGFLIVPRTARLGGRPDTLLTLQSQAEESLLSDLRRVRRSGYRMDLWQYTRERSVTFYYRYLVPHARTRFSEAARPPSFDWVDRLFAAGFALVVLPPDRDEPDAIGVAIERGDVFWLAYLGTRDGDPAVMRRSGGLAALYDFAIRLAQQRGAQLIDMGRSRPWLTDGVTRYKWKWGFRPMTDLTEALEHAVRIVRADGAAAHRLATRRVIVRAGRRFLLMSPHSLVEADSQRGTAKRH